MIVSELMKKVFKMPDGNHGTRKWKQQVKNLWSFINFLFLSYMIFFLTGGLSRVQPTSHLMMAGAGGP